LVRLQDAAPAHTVVTQRARVPPLKRREGGSSPPGGTNREVAGKRGQRMRAGRVVGVTNPQFLGCGLGTRICLASRWPDRCDSDALHQHDRECKAARAAGFSSLAYGVQVSARSPRSVGFLVRPRAFQAREIGSIPIRNTISMPSWWNQQTHLAQNQAVPTRPCRCKSCRGYQFVAEGEVDSPRAVTPL
jgi:hypothetical protein